MTENLDDWIKDQLAWTIDELTKTQLFDESTVEARWTWAHKNQVLIGQVRRVRDPIFYWFVSVERIFTDIVDGGVASDSREALRHFTLKWQLGAERLEELDDAAKSQLPGTVDKAKTDQLRAYAERLYRLTELENIW